MVNITRVYTRTGDAGTTRLSNNEVAPKTDPRVQAYGQVDETNCTIGVALTLDPSDDMQKVLAIVQNELFDVGADLSSPVVADPKFRPVRVDQTSVDRLEKWIDEFGEDLPALRSFILPGGSPLAAQLHVARSTCRRAERAAWEAVEAFGGEDGSSEPKGGVSLIAVKYLNRLSDLLFNLSRHANYEAEHDEVLWVPDGEREV
ncbi:cob(I)yrinic acid a,c-diamide adenosyltransferase [Propionibacterium freudenreichii]|jgi:cob(I)alamin adenosyltransferase|uniref:cob(I)yrinic acid a,c-diamide adenosyltransferase n=1 Tax=Propionibacterium freudenreichii TaxID=1744 RepID=UPI000542A911|nr:cob(I)yrinic acid a,c-diamide adenosyltransferase [Propionibacterium freudenreichii]MCT2973490.1 cob(I)yrinic acid a,c-diamide adenosyltransferase [Propionibacterium freudenreichii]MCT2976281.1 cob(I)yrinic acid a,c-diamide adenosyltransferase [Propionibacterium freudenreichii]MCT2979022.1 cob(I)yrinic acid a,c-diamide adenosyltransferase [Propionibacterium freudenreichii]MCT2984777.1 cob(I)yrinic acid a,c-diamide adenosyltransferase [Propionibacterium freudenreichii]MCT2986779.1 cob(I)yrin